MPHRPMNDSAHRPTALAAPRHERRRRRPCRSDQTQRALFLQHVTPGRLHRGGYASLPMDGGSTFSPERAASQTDQSDHQLPSWRVPRPPLLGRVGGGVLVDPKGAFAARRVDDAGDVAARREHEAHLPAGERVRRHAASQGTMWSSPRDRVDVRRMLRRSIAAPFRRPGRAAIVLQVDVSQVPAVRRPGIRCRRHSSTAGRTPAAFGQAGSCSPRNTRSGRCCATD